MNRTEFTSELYRLCGQGSVELRALPSKHQAFISLEKDTVYTEIDAFCEAHKKDNLYFGVATRDGKGGGKDNIVEIPALFCDLDFKETPREQANKNLKKFSFTPSLIVKSGGGIHLYWLLDTPAEQKDIPTIEDINRRIATQLGGDLNACDASRILRVPDTINHKYPAPCEVAQENEYRFSLDSFLDVLPEVPKNSNRGPTPQDWLSIDMLGTVKGQRNSTAAKIAGYWINKVSPSDVLTILKAWNKNNTPPLPDDDLKTIAHSVSRYEPEKPKPKQTVDISNVYDAPAMLKEYQEYIETLSKNKFITGISEIDKRIRGVAGGEVLTIIARAGSFKTAMLQNMMKNYTQHSSWAAVFFSIEMPIPSITERYHEILGGMPGREVEEIYKAESASDIKKSLEDDFIKDLKNLYVVPVKVGIQDIEAYVKLIESHHNIKVGVIGIDYLGLIDGTGKNEYEIISRLSIDVKRTAKMLNIPIVLLSQVSRVGGSGETEIDMSAGRGSGAIEEAADFVLGLWQVERKQSIMDMPGETDYSLVCKILKNRKGKKGSTWLLELNADNLRIGSESEKYVPPKPNGKSY